MVRRPSLDDVHSKGIIDRKHAMYFSAQDRDLEVGFSLEAGALVQESVAFCQPFHLRCHDRGCLRRVLGAAGSLDRCVVALVVFCASAGYSDRNRRAAHGIRAAFHPDADDP